LFTDAAHHYVMTDMALSFLNFRPRRSDTFVGRLERMRREGAARGAHEARLFKLAVGKHFDRRQAMDWLSASLEGGREELMAQKALEREISTWDMSCRIMFLLMI
jgi:hypothetical protein